MDSLDWSTEWLTSTLWVLGVWPLTVVSLLVVAVIVVRTTTWGGQVWRLIGPWLTPRRGERDSWRPTLRLLMVLLSIVAGVRTTVLISYVVNDLYTALQDLDAAKFWATLGIFAIICVVYVVLTMITYYLGQAMLIRVREYLNERFLGDWMGNREFHRSGFIDDPVDNPDQRIQQDITDFADYSFQLSIAQNGAVDSLVSLVSFSIVLWQLSGPLSILGAEVPHAMVFIAYLYVIVATVIAFRIGRPLIRLRFRDERFGAFYRYGLVRVRDNAENIAFYGGETVERRVLNERFRRIIDNYWRIVGRTVRFLGFNLTVSQFSQVFPLIVQAPRFFAQQISLGDIQQTAQAFGQVHDALSFFRTAYDQFAEYRAMLDRLTGLLDADERARALPLLEIADRERAVAVRDMTVRRPDGEVLVSDLSLDLGAGDTLLVTGRSGRGKTTLLRSLADLWPYAEGELARPVGPRSMFLSQQPYVPLGTLRQALAYPEPPETHSDERLAEVLRAVALAPLAGRLDEDAVWWRVLSPGEQQRLGFGRLLLSRPDVIFLDEATAALDEGLEHDLYTLLRTELPDAVVVSVGHRSSLESYHATRLDLAGEGRWDLSPIGPATSVD